MVLPRPIRLLALAAAAVLGVAAPAAAAPKAAPAAAYRGVIVIDAATGRTLIEDNADAANPPASVAKLMTFLVVHDQIRAGKLSLQTEVTATAEDTRIGGTQVWLKEHEVFTVDELLYALLIQSANDAANALARAAAGSREAFVALMNERARALGMTRTAFTTPHGLPPSKGQKSDTTTPRDLSRLSLELLRSTDVLRYSSTRQRAFGFGKRPQAVAMSNHNHLLGKVRGVDGLKTGFTNAAGFCLAATASRDGRRIIAVIMGCPDRKGRDLRMAEFIEKGFAVMPASSAFADVPVPITAAPPEPADAPAAGDEEENGDPSVRFVMPGKKKS